MIASKFLVSAATAIAVVGTIGLAYAQTTSDSPSSAPSVTTTPATTPTSPTPMAADPALTPRNQATGTTSDPNSRPMLNNDSMSSERAARADRN